jgi:hypothetical protein
MKFNKIIEIMGIKERAFQACKTTYAKYGLKTEELKKIAENIAGGLTDETTDEDLNAAVQRAEFYAEMMQSVGNRKQSEIEKKFEGYVPKPKEEPKKTEEPPTPNPQPTITSEDIQKMVDVRLAEALKPYQEQRERERLNALLSTSTKIKDVPKTFISRYSLDKEEDLETVADKIANDYSELKRELFASGTVVEAPKQPTPKEEDDELISKLAEINKVE